VSQSHREKPVYHVSVAVDMTAAMARREKSKAGGADAVSFDSIFVKAVGTAIAEFPVFQAWLSGESLMRCDSADVAVAIGVGDDLYAPAVRGPGRKGVTEISGEIGELARKAEARSLGAREVEGSCFLVSNLGMFPVESFDAVIYPEHSAALAIGAITHTPVSDGKVTRVAPIARLTLSVDHRLINGRTAARFMARVKQILETGALD
jgi:pyruvate dehydrogenase E2 component (dihydrolipoamide acetyltransferase)